jgi:hypothetical protein
MSVLQFPVTLDGGAKRAAKGDGPDAGAASFDGRFAAASE